MNDSQPLQVHELIGDIGVDDRGSVRFVNDFDFKNVQRFYQVENHSTQVIRAFHGHQKEAKYVYVAKGSAIVCAVKMSNTTKPSKKEPVLRFVLSDKKPKILFIPSGFANGFRALEKDTQILFFSTSTLEQSKNDDFRFPHDYWGTEIWQTENR